MSHLVTICFATICVMYFGCIAPLCYETLHHIIMRWLLDWHFAGCESLDECMQVSMQQDPTHRLA